MVIVVMHITSSQKYLHNGENGFKTLLEHLLKLTVFLTVNDKYIVRNSEYFDQFEDTVEMCFC